MSTRHTPPPAVRHFILCKQQPPQPTFKHITKTTPMQIAALRVVAARPLYLGFGSACGRCQATASNGVASPHGRWLNSKEGGSPLLALPTGALATIARKAGRGARLVCSALSDAYGPSGSGLYIPTHRQSLRSSLNVAQVDTTVLAWTQPEAVRKLHADSRLSPSTCQAVAQAFPHLQELTLHAGAASYATLAAGLTALTALRTPWVSPAAQGAAFARSFSTLQALTLQFSSSCTGVIGTLATLKGLTSLSLTAAPGAIRCRRQEFDIGTERDEGGDGDCGDDHECDDPEAAGGRPTAAVAVRHLEVWGMLAALPKLARLELGLVPNYHSDMPEGEVLLPRLTHLLLTCDSTMVQRDQRRGVEVPLVQVGSHWCASLVNRHGCCSHQQAQPHAREILRAASAAGTCGVDRRHRRCVVCSCLWPSFPKCDPVPVLRDCRGGHFKKIGQKVNHCGVGGLLLGNAGPCHAMGV
jgi:hypothetical protein